MRTMTMQRSQVCLAPATERVVSRCFNPIIGLLGSSIICHPALPQSLWSSQGPLERNRQGCWVEPLSPGCWRPDEHPPVLASWSGSVPIYWLVTLHTCLYLPAVDLLSPPLVIRLSPTPLAFAFRCTSLHCFSSWPCALKRNADLDSWFRITLAW